MSDIQTRAVEEKHYDPEEKGMAPSNIVFTNFQFAASEQFRTFLLNQVPETFSTFGSVWKRAPRHSVCICKDGVFSRSV
eukprot:4286827-Pleurochrysis_carterae.AAC.3